MVFPIVGGTQSTGYNISNSLRFNNNDTAYLNISRSSQSNTTATFSVWTKMGVPSDDNVLFGGHTDVNNRGYIYFSDPDGYVGIFSRTSGSADIAYNSNGKFRDPSAWYHVVVAIDTTDGTAGNRFKMYINGTQYTDWGTATAPSQNASLPILNKAAQTVGGGYGSSSVSSMADSYLADFYYIDGQQLDASNFGETDDNGVWIPKKYDGTYGTNGFKLEFQQTGTGTASASTIGADTSGNDNHLTSNNLAATDVTTDTPTNNFCTLNPLHNFRNDPTYSEGNTKVVFADGGNGASPLSTFAVDSGKWYWEAKFVQTSDPGHGAIAVGIVDADQYNVDSGADEYFDRFDFGFSYNTDGKKKSNNSAANFGDEFNNGDIIGVAVDFDNRQIYFSKNGTFQDSGDPTSGGTGTGSAFNFAAATYYFAVYAYQDENSWEMNFGNAPFSISSSNSDGNGYGSFEYAVPSGYFALCTKNLAEYG
jgi:hypothetical protein